jgi:hypothetical protein
VRGLSAGTGTGGSGPSDTGAPHAAPSSVSRPTPTTTQPTTAGRAPRRGTRVAVLMTGLGTRYGGSPGGWNPHRSRIIPEVYDVWIVTNSNDRGAAVQVSSDPVGL